MPERAIPPEVVALCENAQSYGPRWPGSELIRRDGFDIWLGPPIYPGLSVVLNLRTDDAAPALDDARAYLRDRGRTWANWMIGSSSPPNLVTDLRNLGLT